MTTLKQGVMYIRKSASNDGADDKITDEAGDTPTSSSALIRGITQ
jgi:hypothetical protein